jgi:hypothetical protein
MIQLVEEELLRRRPVWQALSELFLDTETRPFVALSATACLRSGYSEAELNLIWCSEVSPVLAPNLLSPAGEWAGIDQAWLEEKIVHCRRGLFAGAARWVNQKHWAEVCRLITWLRPWPVARRESVANSLCSMVWIALDDSTTHSLSDTDLSEDERQQVWIEAAIPLLTALHVKRVDPPLKELLTRGRAGLYA